MSSLVCKTVHYIEFYQKRKQCLLEQLTLAPDFVQVALHTGSHPTHMEVPKLILIITWMITL